jgi:histidinol phosphatase-like enzyme
VCWCRKPLPGLALLLAHRHGFSLTDSVHVGHSPADRGFAARAGIAFEPI